MPNVYLAPFIVLAGLFVVVVISAVQASRFSWRCGGCGKITNPPLMQVVFSHRAGNAKLMRCPACKKRNKFFATKKQKWQ